MELSDKELLNFAIENGIIDVSDIQQKIEMNERNRYIENHNYSIWQSKDGKFYTYLPDEKYSRGKRLIKRTTEQALNDAIVQFYKERENEPYIEDVFDEWLGKEGTYNFIKWAIKNGWKEYDDITIQTVDRIDPNGDYCPENCRLATMKEQAINKRNTVKIIYNGVKKPLSIFCREFNIPYGYAYGRIKGKGMSAKSVLEEYNNKKWEN